MNIIKSTMILGLVVSGMTVAGAAVQSKLGGGDNLESILDGLSQTLQNAGVDGQGGYLENAGVDGKGGFLKDHGIDTSGIDTTVIGTGGNLENYGFDTSEIGTGDNLATAGFDTSKYEDTGRTSIIATLLSGGDALDAVGDNSDNREDRRYDNTFDYQTAYDESGRTSIIDSSDTSGAISANQSNRQDRRDYRQSDREANRSQ